MSLLTDLQKMDTDLKQVRTDTNVALAEKGGTEVQNLNEIAEAVRGLPSGGEMPDSVKYLTGFSYFELTFPQDSLILDFKDFPFARNDLSNKFQRTKGLKHLKIICNFEKMAISRMCDQTQIETIDFTECNFVITNAEVAFFSSNRLKSIFGVLDFSKCTLGNQLREPFGNCVNLVDIRIRKESIKMNFRIDSCPSLSPESIQSIIDGLATVTSPQTLTLNKNIVLTAEQKETIRTKGWTLAQ